MSPVGVNLATQLRVALDDGEAGRVLQAAGALYPVMAPSPTGRGYWQIRTRTGFTIPRFGELKPSVPPEEQSSEFCALYFGRPRTALGARSDAEGVLVTLFTGRYDEEQYDAVDRTFRVLTDEVLEPSPYKLNHLRGRRAGRVAGYAVGVALPVLAMLWDVGHDGDVSRALADWLALVAVPYRRLALFSVGLAVLGACSSLCGAIGAWAGGGVGRVFERRRLRRLPPLAQTFRYGVDASEQVRREHAVAAEERRKQAEYDRLLTAGIEITPDDFLKVYNVLPYLWQLGLTERQRREEVETLLAKLGPAFPVDIMRLVEPYLPEPRGG